MPLAPLSTNSATALEEELASSLDRLVDEVTDIEEEASFPMSEALATVQELVLAATLMAFRALVVASVAMA